MMVFDGMNIPISTPALPLDVSTEVAPRRRQMARVEDVAKLAGLFMRVGHLVVVKGLVEDLLVDAELDRHFA